MKKTTITMLCLAACFAAADTKITWLADVTADRAETVTGAQSNVIAAAAVHTSRTDNPHGVTAPQIGALTAEQDLAALRAYHYGSLDIVESPAEWFVFDGAGTVMAFNYQPGRENVVIPWKNDIFPVTAIWADAFKMSGIVSVIAPQTVTTIGNNAFEGCRSLASVSLPQAQTFGDSVFVTCQSLASVNLPQATSIGGYAFYDCSSLTSVYMGRNAPAEAAGVFGDITTPPNVYVTDPQATGWGAVWNGAPVVRPPLYAEAIYQAGELVATTAALAVHTNRADNPHGVTAAQVGALTAEADLAALRAYHYGSPDIVESPAGWFVFDGAGTITAFNWAAGRENVVIPWEIGGVPVTAIGSWVFVDTGLESGYPITSLIAPQTVTAIGDSAFTMCSFLATVALPQATTIGFSAFYGCSALTSVNLPQATTIGDYAFTYCSLLTSVHMGQNAPAQASYVFYSITPPPNVYVTDPQATGWGDTWNGAPVVRPPLYGSSVTSQAYTLNGDTITEWPSGGGETSIIAPLYESGTNVTVTSTQSVYSVAVTGAGPVGIDWSGLALDGTGRAEVTLRLNVTEWGGTNVTFSQSLTFDRAPEILVTGVWEFAASTIDGVTTRVRQTWPECDGWGKLDSVQGVSANAGMMHDFAADQTNSITLSFVRETKMLIRYTVQIYTGAVTGLSVWLNYAQAGNTVFSEADIISSRVLTPSVGYHTMMDVAETKYDSPRCVKLWLYPQGYQVRIYGGTVNYRPLNANERAAYAAGWRP